MLAYIKEQAVDALNFFGYLKTDSSPEQILELSDCDPKPKTEFKGFLKLNEEISKEVIADFEKSKEKWITLDGSDDLRKKHEFMPEQYLVNDVNFSILEWLLTES